MHRPLAPRKSVAAAIAPARPREERQPGPVAFAALIFANVALAFGPWFVRLADVGPVAAGFWRLALAAPLLAAMALASGARAGRLAPRLWLALILGGAAFAADLGSWHLGILRTTLANATLFGNMATFIFPIYGFVVARTLPTRTQAIALALAAGGTALLLGRSYQLDPRNLAGDMLCMLAGVLYTVYFIAMARAREAMAPLSALALSTIAGILPILLFATLMGERVWPEQWGALAGLAFFSQVLGQGLMIYALGRFSPLVVGLALLVQPVVGGIIGWVAYDERLAAPDFIGAALVAVALVLVRRGPPNRVPVAPGSMSAQEERA